MKNTKALREAASSVNIHLASFEDLTNAIGEVRLLLARLVIEKDERLNTQSRKAAQVIHDEEKKERDDFDSHVRDTIQSKV